MGRRHGEFGVLPQAEGSGGVAREDARAQAELSGVVSPVMAMSPQMSASSQMAMSPMMFMNPMMNPMMATGGCPGGSCPTSPMGMSSMGGMSMMMAMNPMMMVMNPISGMSPMMAGMQMVPCPTCVAQPAAVEPALVPTQEEPKLGKAKGKGVFRRPQALPIDPQIEELCRRFNIEDRIARRLNDVMSTREDTFDQDMRALWEVCETAQKPSGFLMVKIQELERGVFTGSGKLDRDVSFFAKRFEIDDKALSKLISVMRQREATKRQDLDSLEKHLANTKHTSSALLKLLGDLQSTGRLPPLQAAPQRPERDRRRSRSRSRSRSRGKR